MNVSDFNMKEKDIYKLFNSVRIEESEFDFMDEEVTDTAKKRIKKTLKKRIKGKNKFQLLKYGSIAAIFSLISIIGIGCVSPTLAENIPVFNSIIQKLNNEFGFYGEYERYSQVINKPVKSNGVTLTINEIIADDSKLVIGYTIKSDNKVENLETFGLNRFLQINGKKSASNGSSTGNYTDEHTYVGSEEIQTDLLKNTSSKINITLNVDEISNIKGKWNFSFSVSKDELVKYSVVFKTNIKLDFPNSIANVDKVVFSPNRTFSRENGKNYSRKNRNQERQYNS